MGQRELDDKWSLRISYDHEPLLRSCTLFITKFFDRIWRRYSYVSHLGESFLDLKTFLEFFPEYNTRNDILAQRVDIDSQSFDEEATDDDDNDESADDDSDNKESSSKNVEEEPTLSDLEDSETSIEASS